MDEGPDMLSRSLLIGRATGQTSYKVLFDDVRYSEILTYTISGKIEQEQLYKYVRIYIQEITVFKIKVDK